MLGGDADRRLEPYLQCLAYLIIYIKAKATFQQIAMGL